MEHGINKRGKNHNGMSKRASLKNQENKRSIMHHSTNTIFQDEEVFGDSLDLCKKRKKKSIKMNIDYNEEETEITGKVNLGDKIAKKRKKKKKDSQMRSESEAFQGVKVKRRKREEELRDKSGKFEEEENTELIENTGNIGNISGNSESKGEISKRKLKKQKRESTEKAKLDASRHKTATKVLNYVSKWKHAKSEWKFNKANQIWLAKYFLDEDLIPEKIYPIILEYFQGCKGNIKEKIMDRANREIKKLEELEGVKKVEKSIIYQRAKRLLAIFSTET